MVASITSRFTNAHPYWLQQVPTDPANLGDNLGRPNDSSLLDY